MQLKTNTQKKITFLKMNKEKMNWTNENVSFYIWFVLCINDMNVLKKMNTKNIWMQQQYTKIYETMN